MRGIALTFAALAALASSASAQQQPPPPVTQIAPQMQRTIDRLQAEALESDHAWRIVESLVTEIGPRLAGSPAEARAREWAVAMLRANGFTNVRIEPFTIPFWDATREEAYILGAGGAARPMVAAALGGSPSTPEGGLEGEVVRFASMAALEAASAAAVRGRIVFIDERMIATMDGSGYGAAVRKRGECAPVAQSMGALGCVIRSVGTDPHRFAHQGGSSRQSRGASLPAMALSPADSDTLARLVANGPTRIRLVIEADIRDNVESGNVIAEIRGRDRPDEIVLLAAHLDSWDLGHGAIDDGAGVAIITAAARLIRNLPRRPSRTIRILLAGAEENGVHGGAAYARAHAHENHVVALESDFGAGRVWRFRSRFADEALPHARAFARALAPLGIILGDNQAGGGADIGALRQTGVPVVDLSQDGLDYFNYHHTADDTLHAIDPAALRQNVAAWATFVYMAADTDWTFRTP